MDNLVNNAPGEFSTLSKNSIGSSKYFWNIFLRKLEVKKLEITSNEYNLKCIKTAMKTASIIYRLPQIFVSFSIFSLFVSLNALIAKPNIYPLKVWVAPKNILVIIPKYIKHFFSLTI